MDPSLVDAIILEISKHWNLANDVEITLEANPTSAEAKNFRGYSAGGVNRVSIGIQALNNQDLRALGRLHSVDEALNTVEMARNIFKNFSFDLIYARQNQTLDAWQSELQRALSFEPHHLSMYQLTIEDGTAFGDRFQRGLLKGLPDEDLAADMYLMTQEMCNAAGLPAYEVSNHAKPGRESRHNLIYWRGGDYIGIGPGAHGRLTTQGNRIATDTALAPTTWLKSALGGNGDLNRETLKENEVAKEYFLMGLRLSEGVELDQINQLHLNVNKINMLSDEELILDEDGRLVVMPKGRPLLNAILREILDD